MLPNLRLGQPNHPSQAVLQMRTLLLLATPALATTRVVVDDVTTTTRRVDTRYVSSVLDPSSLDCGASRNQFSDPRGAGLANLTHSKLRNFVRSLAPTLVVVTGGRSNCLDATTRKAWRSPYCQARGYGGACDLAALDAFSTATGADVAWHVNPAFRDANGNFDVNNAPSPSSSTTLLLYEELHERPPRPTKQKLPIVDGGVQASASSVARDFASLRKRYDAATIVGLLNQDTDQAPTWTDAVYRASKSSVDVVAFSYYASTVALPLTLSFALPKDVGAAASSWNLDGSTVSLSLADVMITVKDLKAKLSAEHCGGMPGGKFQLKSAALGFLKDRLSVAHYNLKASEVIEVSLKTRGKR